MKVKEYAKLMGLHPESVRRSIRNGEIPANLHGREWLIDEEYARAMTERETRFAKTEESAYLIKKRLLTQRSRWIIILEFSMREGVKEIEKLRELKINKEISFDEHEEQILEVLSSENGVITAIKTIERLTVAIEEMDGIIRNVEKTENHRDDSFSKEMKRYVEGVKEDES